MPLFLTLLVSVAPLFAHGSLSDTLSWNVALPVSPSVTIPAMADTDVTLHAASPSDSLAASVRDTTLHRHRERPQAIEYSDWYARRLAIHKGASYATLPLFVVQYITGNQLLKEGRYASPARYIHPPVATAIGALFLVNTITGVWNLKESWPDPAGRTQRTIHSTLMLLADAGFVLAGELAKPGLNSNAKRQEHMRVALISMGVSLTGYFMMLPPFRRN